MKSTLETLGTERFNLVMELSDNADAVKDAETMQEALKFSCERITMERALGACIAHQERAAAEVAELDNIYLN